MKKRIYFNFLLVAFIAIILTFLMSTMVYKKMVDNAGVIPVIIIVLMVITGVCILLAHFLAKSIISPIENLSDNLDKIDEIETYPELKPLIKTIIEQNGDLVKNTNLRSEFTANITHELKTPLTSILGYSELIENGITSKEDTLKFGKEIHKNSKRLLRLIEDIIRLSEIDLAYKGIEFENVDMYEVARDCVDMMQINASGNNVSLSIEGSSQIIRANKSMLEDVICNLCENAIRYNRKNGRVEVRVGCYDNHPYLEIEDTGIGISKKHQDRIFERFYRVDKSRSKSTGGTGLGLAIVKHTVARHNAKIELESLPGVGTKIRVVFESQV